jgi:hypothetical protein
LWPSRKDSWRSAGNATTKLSSECGKAMQRKCAFCSTPSSRQLRPRRSSGWYPKSLVVEALSYSISPVRIDQSDRIGAVFDEGPKPLKGRWHWCTSIFLNRWGHLYSAIPAPKLLRLWVRVARLFHCIVSDRRSNEGLGSPFIERQVTECGHAECPRQPPSWIGWTKEESGVASEPQAYSWLVEDGPKGLELLFRTIVFQPSAPIPVSDDDRR